VSPRYEDDTLFYGHIFKSAVLVHFYTTANRYSLVQGNGCQKLWKEIRPFALFSKRRYGGREDVLCKPNLGNKNMMVFYLSQV
jgi:hypothetical protein